MCIILFHIEISYDNFLAFVPLWTLFFCLFLFYRFMHRKVLYIYTIQYIEYMFWIRNTFGCFQTHTTYMCVDTYCHRQTLLSVFKPRAGLGRVGLVVGEAGFTAKLRRVIDDICESSSNPHASFCTSRWWICKTGRWNDSTRSHRRFELRTETHQHRYVATPIQVRKIDVPGLLPGRWIENRATPCHTESRGDCYFNI